MVARYIIFGSRKSLKIARKRYQMHQIDPVNISMPAKVTYINAIDPLEEYRLGFMTYPKPDQKEVIRRFVFDCQTEMFDEIEQDQLSKPRTKMIL